MNALSFAVDVLGVLYLGRLLEPIWGTAEFVRLRRRCASLSGASPRSPPCTRCTCARGASSFCSPSSGAFTACSWRSPSRSGSSSPRSACPLPLRRLARAAAAEQAPAGRQSPPPASGPSPTARSTTTSASGCSPPTARSRAGATCGTSRGCVEAAAAEARRRRDDGRARPPRGDGVAFGDDREEFEFAAQFPDACAPAVRFVTDPIHALVFGGKPRGVSSENTLAAAPPTRTRGARRRPASDGKRRVRRRGGRAGARARARRASAGGEARNRGERARRTRSTGA